jgi:tRNA1(Val) A37 N6-methylase TrmN6
MQLKENEVLEELYNDKKIIQNTQLYRFTSDSILLSRFARAKYRDNVADFCAGSGIVGLHFACLNPHISTLTLFEMQKELSDMSARTVEYNSFKNVNVVNCRLQDIGREYDDKFSAILCNPPYETAGFDNLSYEKAICRKEITITLAEIIDIAYKKLKFGGRLAIINRADRVAELIYLLKNRGLEPKKMQFVCGAQGAKPYLVMVEAGKGAKQGIEVLPSLVNNQANGTCVQSEDL